jgi:L-aminopeptidase/D-esterase-like protein
MPRPPRSNAPIRGVRIGHAENPGRSSGVTAVLFDAPAAVVVDIRGGASATFDTGSLSLDATFGLRWGLFLAGGSVFGLDAAAGVRACILEHGGGAKVFRNPHRIASVSGAALFDLPSTMESLPDYRALGYAAARHAGPHPIAVGRVGAGAGATVGKYLGREGAMRGGLGWSSIPFGTGQVGALVAVNSVGAVRDPARGTWIAGARGPRGRIVPPPEGSPRSASDAGTTLSILVTDIPVSRATLQRVAAIAHAALGSVIVPLHTATDGDVLFAVSARQSRTPPRETRPGGTADALGTRAARCLIEAVLRAVRAGNRTP